MVPVRTAALLILLCGCSGPPVIEVVRSGALPEGKTDIDLGETPLYRVAYRHPIHLRSHSKSAIHVQARLEGPVAEAGSGRASE